MTIHDLPPAVPEWCIGRGEFRGIAVDIKLPVLMRKRPGLVVSRKHTSDGFILVNDCPTEIRPGRTEFVRDPVSHVSRLRPTTKEGPP